MKLDIENLQKTFGIQSALDQINLSVNAQTLVLLGPSGGGKSTLLRLIGGLDYPDKGSISLDDKKIIFEEKDLIKHRKSIGTVFQSWNLFPHLTALENISLPLFQVHGYSKKDAKERGIEFLKRFNLEKHADKKPSELSGGQCQRVAIVRAVAIKPKLLLFDEPTSALDPLMTSEVLDLIQELKNEGSNFILVSHQIGFAKKTADWIVFIQEGKMIESRPALHFFEGSRSPQVQEFLDKILKY